jgi:dienelactone hydrolase
MRGVRQVDDARKSASIGFCFGTTPAVLPTAHGPQLLTAAVAAACLRMLPPTSSSVAAQLVVWCLCGSGYVAKSTCKQAQAAACVTGPYTGSCVCAGLRPHAVALVLS